MQESIVVVEEKLIVKLIVFMEDISLVSEPN